MKDHWDKVYLNKDLTDLGWYEKNPEATIKLFTKCNVSKTDEIIDVGAGTSFFIDYLIENDFEKIIALDISEVAFQKKKSLLGKEKAKKVSWITGDITHSSTLMEYSNIKLWNDRALLHFLRDPQQRQIYLNHLNKSLKSGGYAIIGSFSLMGAKKCSGLDIQNYNVSKLQTLLGDGYSLLESFEYTYLQPSGNQRPYIYTLFQKH